MRRFAVLKSFENWAGDRCVLPGKMRLLLAWMAIHEDELMADWDLAVHGQ